jgi:hypothetical protein
MDASFLDKAFCLEEINSGSLEANLLARIIDKYLIYCAQGLAYSLQCGLLLPFFGRRTMLAVFRRLNVLPLSWDSCIIAAMTSPLTISQHFW